MDGLFQKLGHIKDLDINYGGIKQVPVMASDTDEITEIFADTILKLGYHADLLCTTDAGTILEVLGESQEDDDGETGEA